MCHEKDPSPDPERCHGALLFAGCDDDVSTQIQQINNFALLGADMIIIMPTEIEALTDAIQNAHDAGCKILINGATGDSGALDGYYDTCTVSDEYLIGATVSMVAKKWAEQHLDPDGDWEVAFLICTLSDETIDRSNGMKSVMEECLKNADGEYVDAMGNVVDEAGKIPNPNYSELIASHFKGMEVEQDVAQSNYTTTSNVMTQDAHARLFLCYNSLASTEGGQYIVDNYAGELDEFGFFSAGVLERRRHRLSRQQGHQERGHVQDFDPIAELKDPETTIYWNPDSGYNQEAVAEQNSGSGEPTAEPVEYELAEGPVEAGTYTCDEVTPFGFTVNWTVTLNDDGTYEILEGNPELGDKTYTGDEWTDNGDGTVVGMENGAGSGEPSGEIG